MIPRAGAMWRSNALPDEIELQEWDRLSYLRWLEMSKMGKQKNKLPSGVEVSSSESSLPHADSISNSI
jgi:hypothetical protein